MVSFFSTGPCNMIRNLVYPIHFCIVRTYMH